MKPVVRIAPSPTGNLHIGTARTALFNFLFAKKYGGKFIVRIEDTDTQRSTKEFEKNIMEGFEWLRLKEDEFFRQSERTEIYKKYLSEMIKNGTVYFSKEDGGEGKRAEVIRFKNPNKKIKFNDLVRGEVEFDTTELKDFVVAKSETEPLYHLAVVIDDHEMKITHVIRGEDHISNTPRQILIQEAIGAKRPEYAHIPLILAKDRSKLSKRHGATSISEYKERGYLPDAINNYLALLGWNPGDDREIFSMEELINSFEIERVQKGGAIFDEEKLKWINKEHIKRIDPEELKNKVLEQFKSSFLKNKKLNNIDEEMLNKILPLILERSNTWKDIDILIENSEFDYFFNKPEIGDTKKILWKDEKDFDKTARLIDEVVEILSNIEENNFTHNTIKESVWQLAEKEGRGTVLWPMRFSLSGREKSPDPFVLAEILGKTETLERLKSSSVKLKNK